MDRLLGGLFGLAKVVLVASVLLLMAASFFPLYGLNWRQNPCLPHLLFRSAEYLEAFLEQHGDAVQRLIS